MRPRLSQVNIWRRHEEFVLAVFREALELLRDEPPQDVDEPAFNRQLYKMVVRANYRRLQRGEGSLHSHAPTPEGLNPPSPTTEGTVAEYKRPDFYWGYIDTLEQDPDRSVRNLTIECKRIGPGSSSWNLLRNYVRDGIVRFVEPDHSYGKDAPSGTMIGYVSDIAMDLAAEKISEEIAAANLPEMVADPAASSENFRQHRQELTRSFPVSPFTLHHLWSDVSKT